MKEKNKRNYSNQKGITLIALVVTIVVLLILAGVSVNALFGNSGIIEKAKEAQNKMDKATENDQKQIGELTDWIDNQVNGTTGGSTTGGDDTSTTPKISTLVGTVVDKNTKAEDAYGNKITIPKGFKVLAHGTAAGSATYTYSGDNIPAVQDGIVIEHGTDGNQFVWVPVGTIKNKDNTSNKIILGRYSSFNVINGEYTPTQSAENYTQETVIKIGGIRNQNYTIAKLNLENKQNSGMKINKAIQLEGLIYDITVTPTAGEIVDSIEYQELSTFREGNTAKDFTGQNATARNLKTFIETSLENGGYYIARFEASKNTSTNQIESKYNKIVLTDITQPNAATAAREMYGEVKENNELVYASDLVNSYAWDTAIIFIQTYGTGEDASSYANKNKSTSFVNTGKNSDKYCNIWDISGNAMEWSTEYSNRSGMSFFYPFVSRGGYYNTNVSEAAYYTVTRTDSTVDSNTDTGLRSILYVK